MGLHTEQDVEDQADSLHLRADHAGAAQEGEKSGEHPGAAAICGADDAADRFGLRKAFHPRHQESADEDHGQAEAEEGERGANAAGKGFGGVSGGITASDVGSGQGGENDQRAVPATGCGKVCRVTDIAAAAQAHDDQQQNVCDDNTGIQPHGESPLRLILCGGAEG